MSEKELRDYAASVGIDFDAVLKRVSAHFTGPIVRRTEAFIESELAALVRDEAPSELVRIGQESGDYQ